MVSEASLVSGLGELLAVPGELVRMDEAGEYFMADLAGEMDRGGGLCLTPLASTMFFEKCAYLCGSGTPRLEDLARGAFGAR